MSVHVVKRCAECKKYIEIDTDLYELKYQDKYRFPKPIYFCCPTCLLTWKRKHNINSVSDKVMRDLENYLAQHCENELKIIRANRQIILKRKAQAEFDLKRLDLIEKQIKEKYNLQK